MRYLSRLTYFLLLGLFLLPGQQKGQSRALAFAWGGQVQTDIQAQGFWAANHTISIWFMGQYPGAYTGPMVASAPSPMASRFAFGQGRFTASNNVCRVRADSSVVRGETILYVQIGNTYWDYQASQLRTPGVWHHLAFVRNGNQFSLYLDGVRLTEEDGRAENIPPAFVPAGDLMLGDDEHPRRQYYGLLDEFQIYTQPLTVSEIMLLAQRQPPGIPSGATWVIEDFDNGVPANWSRTDGCELVKTTWNNANDAAEMLPPNHETNFLVPFPAGEMWEVMQGQDNYQGDANSACGSHIGNASFCVDMRRVGPDFSKQSDSEGQEITASSAGVMDTVINENETTPANWVKVLAAPEEYISYMHFSKESNVLQEGDSVQPLDFIAKVSDVGSPGRVHLHHALSTARATEDGVTRPFAWSNYEYSTDKGATWTFASRRMPQQGDWVRNQVSLQRTSGKLKTLRVNEVGIPYGSGDDKIDGEVIITLEGESGRRAYGFQLRKDVDEISHSSMLDQLRTAFLQDRSVTLTFSKTGDASFKRKVINVELD